MQNNVITDSLNPLFQEAFKAYFDELGVSIKDWDGLFQEMKDQPGNVVILKLADNNQVIGFIQIKIDTATHWFFEETLGFIREFWVDEPLRGQGYGTALLHAAEDYFVENGAYKAILTTDTAPDFYHKNGYVRDVSYVAKNKDEVFTKLLR